MVKSNGRLNQYFQQSGTPFVTILKNGVMVWESDPDTPEKLSSAILQDLIADDSN